MSMRAMMMRPKPLMRMSQCHTRSRRLSVRSSSTKYTQACTKLSRPPHRVQPGHVLPERRPTNTPEPEGQMPARHVHIGQLEQKRPR